MADIKMLEKTSRSARFPSVTLDYAVKVISEARKFGKILTDAHIAGEDSAKSGAFLRKKASLGYYGLISGRGNDLTVTELAEKIIYPKTEQEKQDSLKKAFTNPELFKRLFDSIEKETPISVDRLGSIVIREHGVLPSAKERFIVTFIKSGNYAGLIEYNDKSKGEIILKKLDQPQPTPTTPKPFPFSTFLEEDDAVKEESSSQSVEISLSKGTGKIVVPAKFSGQDAEKLKRQIDVFVNTE